MVNTTAITLCLITKNESLNISKCLGSFKKLTHHILIADTGSTDNTLEITKNHKATTTEFTWCNDFSKARNFCISQVSTPWTMMVDADQFMSNESITLFKKNFTENQEHTDVFYLENSFHGDTLSLPKVWRTSLNAHYHYPVHERLRFPEKNPRITHSSAIIENTPQSDYSASRTRYVSIMEDFIKEHPTDHHILYYLVSDNDFLNNHEKTLYWASKYFETNPTNDNDISRVMLKCAHALIHTNQTPQAYDTLQKAIEFNPENAEAYFQLAQLYQKENHLEEAKEWYKRLISKKFQKSSSHYSNPDAIQEKAQEQLESFSDS